MRDDQVRRYARHILLPDVGGVGQRRLLEGAARLATASGADAVAIVYLAAGGVGRIVVATDGTVDAGDVAGGWLYEVDDLGKGRIEAARARAKELNPDVEVLSDPHGMAPPPPRRRGEEAAGEPNPPIDEPARAHATGDVTPADPTTLLAEGAGRAVRILRALAAGDG